VLEGEQQLHPGGRRGARQLGLCACCQGRQQVARRAGAAARQGTQQLRRRVRGHGVGVARCGRRDRLRPAGRRRAREEGRAVGQLRELGGVADRQKLLGSCQQLLGQARGSRPARQGGQEGQDMLQLLDAELGGAGAQGGTVGGCPCCWRRRGLQQKQAVCQGGQRVAARARQRRCGGVAESML
jgi:hypothetical protein